MTKVMLKKLMFSSKEFDMTESEILISLKFFFFFTYRWQFFFCLSWKDRMDGSADKSHY